MNLERGHVVDPLRLAHTTSITVAALLFVSTASNADIGKIDVQQFIQSARNQIGVTLGYDPAYRVIAYPNGDVPLATGVCTDVIIRALRDQKIDLQELVHEDMHSDFKRYPKRWGLIRTDKNIDHRRVPNLMTHAQRTHHARTTSRRLCATRSHGRSFADA